MARLDIDHVGEERCVLVTLSRRNLLALLQKLDMPGSKRQLENNDCWEDGVQCPSPGTTLLLRAEDDEDHYGKRSAGPGILHPETERVVREQGGIPGTTQAAGKIVFIRFVEGEETDEDDSCP